MRYFFCCLLLFVLNQSLFAQSKKPLDHSVYDGWQSVAQPNISNDGKWVVYQINPQEGDGELVIQSTDGSYRKVFARGYNQIISDDSRYVAFKIRPHFKETRDARIKKKRPDDMPKDSLCIVELGKETIWKTPRVKSFKVPEKTGVWLAYHLEKTLPVPAPPAPKPDSITQINKMIAMADSLLRVADSLKLKANEAKLKGINVLQKKPVAKSATKTSDDPVEEGTEMIVRNTTTGEEKKFMLVTDYYFSKSGNVLLIETSKKNGDTLSKALVLWMNMTTGIIDTVMKGFNDAKNYTLDEEGNQLAFVAERDSASKALKKFYKLWVYKPGMTEAFLKADKLTQGVKTGFTISPDYNNKFSKNGQRLFFGLAPIRKPKDTTLVDFETARLDLWHYKEDYLQTQQLFQVNNELRRSYLAIINNHSDAVTMLGDPELERIETTDDDNADIALGETNKPYRVQSQWEQSNMNDVYLVNTNNGERKLVAKKIRSGGTLSPKANYVLWYDWKMRHYFTYHTASAKIINITKNITFPLWDEDDEHPDDPPPYGLMGWHENDAFVYVYDRFDIWKVDPSGNTKPVCISDGIGRKQQLTFRYIRTDREEQFLKSGQKLMLSIFDWKEKGSGIKIHELGSTFSWNASVKQTFPFSMQNYIKAKNNETFGFLKGNYTESYNLNVVAGNEVTNSLQLSNINPQQNQYNWGTAELFKWKTYNGKISEGIIYKPEDFDPKKKYPMICYFYETHSETLHQYQSPSPTPSRLNIPFFVSRGYIVFSPDIHYTIGHPAKDCYNHVVSGARAIVKLGYVDSTKMGIQGQSWGGIQVAQLVTMTNLFAAAWSGAPVANMTSAYGGIRWEGGINRQFQYEKSQSRIGANLWEKLPLYIENSPLFHLPKVKTPIVIMANDADGAVPWYQGIELFTGLRRLGKVSWLINYNGEAHNLVERRNRKDIQIREQQFFDHYLKGAPMPKWMKYGVPATEKGIEWGLEIE
jgi:dipeptidyl aminopeptidase/acylaminoacyl peptidase